MKKIPMLERFAAQSLVEYEGELIFSKEKFAELIVRECIECADVVGKANYVSSYPNSTAHHIKQKIKEHFGVDE
jgi:hypothetical protein